ncbi:ATP-binding protein [soil metagenome]
MSSSTSADDGVPTPASASKFPFNSLRLRLLVSLLAVLSCAVLAVGGITYRSVLESTQELFDYQLRQMALTLREQGSIGGQQAQTLTDEGLDFVVQIWTVDGRSVFTTRRHDVLPTRAVIGFADVVIPGGPTWRTYSVVTRDFVIQVAQPIQIRKRLAAAAAFQSVVPLLLLTPILGLAVWWLIALAVAPMRRVAAEVRSRDAGALSPVSDQGLPEEVTPLVQSLNALLGRVSASFDAQRAFVADAAHELRSPLTALKLQIELLRRAPDDVTRVEAVSALGEGVDRASRLVDQLLALARSESTSGPHGLQNAAPLALSELVRQALADTVPYAVSRGTQLSLEGDDSIRIPGDRASLAILVRNLVDNAVRYSPPGSTVRVGVARDEAEGGASLIVDDAGPGIPPAERSRVLDRFYRREETAGEGNGTGLGLAIVKNIADRHGATLTLGESPAGGLRVVVRFGSRPVAD